MYEPQFRYQDDAAAKAACRQPPREDYLPFALAVLEGVRERYGCESRYHQAVWGKYLRGAREEMRRDRQLALLPFALNVPSHLTLPPYPLLRFRRHTDPRGGGSGSGGISAA